MAKLHSDKLTLEIKFATFNYGWIVYEIGFYWQDGAIVNDDILKRNGECWNSRSFGAFLANDYAQDHLIETLEKVLDTNEPDYWEPIDPDVIIAIYPEIHFPFLPAHYEVIYESQRAKHTRERWEKEKQEREKLPDAPVTIITLIDAYNFKNCDAYSGDGISLHLTVNRGSLEEFVMQLNTEYKEFCQKYIR